MLGTDMAMSTDSVPALPDLSHLPHVVIIGGGFGGIAVAKGLAKKDVRVTIVDQHNFHTFSPLLYQVATAQLEPAEVAYPIRTIFGKSMNVNVRHAKVRGVDHARNVIHLENGKEMAYDHLVIATGASASYFGIPGASTYAMPLYSLADARKLRNRLLLALEEADAAAEESPMSLNFVIVGGGPTGVETSGALSELIRTVIRRDGLRIDPSRMRVLLVDMAPRLLTPFPEKASSYALKELEHMGVEIEFGRSVVEVEEHAIRFADGERLQVAAVIWAAGVTAGGSIADSLGGAPGPGGRVRVNTDLRLLESENIWAVGDAAAVPSGEGMFCPQLAPVAMQTGRHCAAQILRVENNEPTKPFTYKNKGIMATIGRHRAVATLPRGPVISGFLGWLAWLGLHLWYLVGFRNRLRVMMNWTWRYFDWPSGPRIIVADAETAD
jgi:NADH dehydrogenase